MMRSNSSGFGFIGLCVGTLVFASCDEPETQPQPTEVRQLDELSTAQRRVFLKGFPGDWREETAMAQGLPEPAPALPIPPDAEIIDLPAPVATELPLGEAIARRRSHREFTSDPLTLEQFSFLLASTQGITSEEESPQLRAAPSGGARYPLETFLAVQRINGLKAGLYRYLPPKHQLLLVRKDPAIATNLQRACYDNATVGSAAVTFIWAAVPERTEWKYGCIAHKMIAIEAGHVCQNLYLASEAIGAGTCALLAYNQPALDTFISADGNDVFTIYLAAVGKPEKE